MTVKDANSYLQREFAKIYASILGKQPNSQIKLTLGDIRSIQINIMYEWLYNGGKQSVNVFIYGTKEAGVNIAKAIRVNLRNNYRLRGFISDEAEVVGKVMMGVEVFPNDENLIQTLHGSSS